MGRKKKYDEAAIKLDYMQGMPWLKLMERHKVPNTTLALYIKRGDWEEQRAEYLANLGQEMVKKRSTYVVKSLIDFNEQVEQICDFTIALVKNQIIRLAKAEQDARHIKMPYNLDPDLLGKLVKIVEMTTGTKFKVLGIDKLNLLNGNGSLPGDIEADYIEIDMDIEDGNETIALYNALSRERETLEEEKIKLLQESNTP